MLLLQTVQCEGFCKGPSIDRMYYYGRIKNSILCKDHLGIEFSAMVFLPELLLSTDITV